VQARVVSSKQPLARKRALMNKTRMLQHCASMACGPVNGMMGTMGDRTIVEDLVADERDACHPQPCVREPVEPHSHVASLFLSPLTRSLSSEAFLILVRVRLVLIPDESSHQSRSR
jgi:hypothetical protein